MRRSATILLTVMMLAALAVQPALAAEGAVSLSAEPDWNSPAKGVLIQDLDSGQILYEKGADERIHPASTTKIMTALCVAEKAQDLDGETVTVREDVLAQLPGGDLSLSGLKAGQQLTVRQLLYCLLLSSGNDAAVVAANWVSGSMGQFVSLMNQRAGELGCQDTHFTNPHGLDEAEHYSTARDLARMAQAFLEVPVLAEIAATAEYDLPGSGGTTTKEISTNLLLHPESELYDPYAVGVKTGMTPEGASFVSAGDKDGLRFLCVVTGVPSLDGQGQFIDPNPAVAEGRKLHQWVYDTFRRVSLCDARTALNLAIDGVDKPVAVLPGETVAMLLPSATAAKLIPVYTALPGLEPPLKAGTEVGSVTWTADGQNVSQSVPLYLKEDVSGGRSPLLAIGLVAVIVLAGGVAGTKLFRRRRRYYEGYW